MAGSPPPMRGKGLFTRFCFCHAGITPAYAGKRLQMKVTLLPARDHPRLCGEKHEICVCRCFLAGSPPPMRGKADPLSRQYRRGRITPAYAGKSRSCPSPCHRWRDHPRLCGEKFAFVIHFRKKLGSPPPMRGKVQVKLDALRSDGITPAYAGKRLSRPHKGCEMWDHPRLCGEKLLPQLRGEDEQGSPPPMRGKGAGDANPDTGYRITPAYAGKSF